MAQYTAQQAGPAAATAAMVMSQGGCTHFVQPQWVPRACAVQVSNVDGEEQRGMHLFKCGDVAAAKELNEKVLEFV